MMKWVLLLIHLPVGATCVTELNYPTQLHLPTLEHWARDSFFGVPSPELECTMVRKLARSFAEFARRSDLASPSTKLGETQAKRTCLAGQFQPRLDGRLNQRRQAMLRATDLFANLGVRQTRARFANGAAHQRPDWSKDVRSLALQVDLGGGRTQDFSFNNVPRFPIDGIDGFNLLLEMSNGLLSGEIDGVDTAPAVASLFNFFKQRYGSLAATRSLYSLKKTRSAIDADLGWVDSYLTQTYWSGTAFALGETNRDVGELLRVVKFGAMPCNEKKTVLSSEIEARNASRLKGIERPNYLRDDLLGTIDRTPACFKIFVEFLDEDKTVTGTTLRASELVEDPSIKWQAPIYTVGELTLDRKVDQLECDQPRRTIDPLRHQSGMVGVGQINRARAYVETANQAWW